MLARLSARAITALARTYLPRFRSGALPRRGRDGAPCVSYFRAALNEPCRRPSVCACVRVFACSRVYAPTSLPSEQVEQTAVLSRRGLNVRDEHARGVRKGARTARTTLTWARYR